ncbi:MAG: urease accessory protein UreH [Chloroflexi bacterium]|nr:urease accessory protein UreH [Chloroflexota bacterium]
MEQTLIAALVLGLLLGMRHALDPDHVVAVSTIVSDTRNPLRAFWVGTSWGLGHTTTLLIMGLFIIGLRLAIPERLALFFEFSVGIVLVLLGIQVLLRYRSRRVHVHAHAHIEEPHRHFHSHGDSVAHVETHHRVSVGRPFVRGKSYLVGTVHGLAGSAALMLLVLTTIKTPLAGLLYIVLFGLGSVASMGVLTILIGLPFVLSAGRFPGMNSRIQLATGCLSILFGLVLMYQIGIVGGLFA